MTRRTRSRCGDGSAICQACRIRAKSRPRLQAVAGISMTELITPMLPLIAVARRGQGRATA
jgi:hypothetical protein